MKYNISDKRKLTNSEIKFLTFLFKKEKPEWNNLIKNLKVIARCGCGICPSISFGKNLESEIQKGSLIIDYKGENRKGELIGVFIWGNNIMPTELEFYSINGDSNIMELPSIKTLKPRYPKSPDLALNKKNKLITSK